MKFLDKFYCRHKGKIICAGSAMIFYLFLDHVTKDAFNDGIRNGFRQGNKSGYQRGYTNGFNDVKDVIKERPDTIIDICNKVKGL